jgi:hypothetical protein
VRRTTLLLGGLVAIAAALAYAVEQEQQLRRDCLADGGHVRRIHDDHRGWDCMLGAR